MRVCKADQRDQRIRAMEWKLGEAVMENELLREKIDRIEDGRFVALHDPDQ